MNKTIVIKLFSRSYVIEHKHENEYKSFIVTEIPKSLKNKDTLIINNAIEISNSVVNNISVEIQLIALLTRKIQAFKKNRRKRYTRNIGYKQHYGYFKINKINN